MLHPTENMDQLGKLCLFAKYLLEPELSPACTRSGVRYESSLERDFLELMMADSQVAEIDGQPITIHYIDQEKKARRH